MLTDLIQIIKEKHLYYIQKKNTCANIHKDFS